MGLDDKIYHNYQVKPNNEWKGVTVMNGQAKQIVAAKNQDGRLEIFYVAVDNKIFHNWQVQPNSS